MLRKIITIDQEKCEGCGTCITECTKGAIRLINGKATLVDSMICDAGGSCALKCPLYAITLTEAEAEEFNSSIAVNEMLRKMLAYTPPAFPPAVFSWGIHCPCLKTEGIKKELTSEGA